MTTATLDQIVDSVRKRSAERRLRMPLDELARHVRPDASRRDRFVAALTKPDLAFLTALERASPSGGRMLNEEPGARSDPLRRAGPHWHALAAAMRAGGADALVVGTESDHYDGELEDIQSVAFTELPVMRADFIVDDGMVLESALHGAHAVQIVAAILDDATLARLRATARSIGLAVMIEVHHERDFERALPHAPELLGVNSRDRRTMTMDPSAFERLLPRVPRGTLRVALSGLTTDDDMRRARAAGADVALAGGAIMKAPDPVAALRGWKLAVRGMRR